MARLTIVEPLRDPDPGVAKMVGMEALYAISAGGLYVSGASDALTKMLSRPLRSRPNRQRSARRLPVLLLHGLGHNQSWSVKIQRELQASGFACRSLNYHTFSRRLDDCGDIVAARIAEVAEESRAPAVHVIAHSIGGLVLRSAINRHREIADVVATGVTIGTPHNGTPWAITGSRLIPKVGHLVEELRPGSETLANMDEMTLPGNTKWYAIWSNADQIVPGDYGRLENPALDAVQIELRGLGHYGLTFNERAIDTVVDCAIESDSSALTAGLDFPPAPTTHRPARVMRATTKNSSGISVA